MTNLKCQLQEMVALVSDVRQRGQHILSKLDEERTISECSDPGGRTLCPDRGRAGLTEREQVSIDRRLLESMQQADMFRQKCQELEKEKAAMQDEMAVLRYICALREDEFKSEKSEREQTQRQLTAVRAELQQLRATSVDPQRRTFDFDTPQTTHQWTRHYRHHVDEPPSYYPHLGYDVTDDAIQPNSTSGAVTGTVVRPSVLEVRRLPSTTVKEDSRPRWRASDKSLSPLTARGSPPPAYDGGLTTPNDWSWRLDDAQTDIKIRLSSSDSDVPRTLASSDVDLAFDRIDVRD